MLHNQELKTTATLEKKTTAPSGEPLSKAQMQLWSSLDDWRKVYHDTPRELNPNFTMPGSLFRKEGWTPLAYAVDKSNSDIVHTLLERNASAEQNYPGQPYSLLTHVLQEAGEVWKSNHLQIIRDLIFHGAIIPKQLTSKKMSTFVLALMQNYKYCYSGDDWMMLYVIASTTLSDKKDANETVTFEKFNFTCLTRVIHMCVSDDRVGADGISFQLNTVRILIQKGADLNAKYAETPFSMLDIALLNKRWELAHTLIQSGAKIPERITMTNWSPLAWVVTKSKDEAIELVETLLEQKEAANSSVPKISSSGQRIEEEKYQKEWQEKQWEKLNIPVVLPEESKEEWSLLAWAVSKNYCKIAASLLKHGANPNKSLPNPSISLVDFALTNDYWHLSTLLIQYGATISPQLLSNGFSALAWPVVSYQKMKAKLHDHSGLRRGGYIQSSWTGVNKEAKIENEKLIDIIAQRVKDIDHPFTIPESKLTWTALEFSAFHTNTMVIRILVRRGARPDQVVNNIDHFRTSLKSLKFSDLLSSSETILEFALLEYLYFIEKSMDSVDDSVIKYDTNAFLLSEHSQYQSIAMECIRNIKNLELDNFVANFKKLVEARKARTIKESLFFMVRKPDMRSLEKAKEDKADFTIREPQGNTLLHCAAEVGAKEDIFNLLYKSGCHIYIDKTNNNGVTPLYLAVKSDQVNAAKFLMRHGPDLARKYPVGTSSETILVFSLRTKRSLDIVRAITRYVRDINAIPPNETYPPLTLAAQYGHLDALHHFIEERHASINYIDSQGKTPLMHAVINGHADAVQLLLEAEAHYDLSALKQLSQHDKITEILEAHHKFQRAHKERISTLTHHLFLALFADVVMPQKGAQKYQTLIDYISRVLSSLPQTQAWHKIDFEGLAVNEEKKPQETKQFVSFLKLNVLPKVQAASDTKKRWMQALNQAKDSDEKVRFGSSLKDSMKLYMDASFEELWYDHLSSKIVFSVEAKINNSTVKAYVKEILQKNKYIQSKLSQSRALSATKSFFSLSEEEKLIELICQQIEYAAFNSADAFIYKTRIEAALDMWLHEHQFLNEQDENAYLLAQKFTGRLLSFESKDHESKNASENHSHLSHLVFPMFKKRFLALSRTDQLQMNEDQVFQFLSTGFMSERWNAVCRARKDFENVEVDIQMSFEKVHMQQKSQQAITQLEINRENFIKSFIRAFDKTYRQLSSLDEKTVQRNEETIDKIAGALDKVKLPDLNFHGIPIPCDAIKTALCEFGVMIKSWQVAKAARTITELFSAHEPEDILPSVRKAAKFIADRYEDQLKQLSSEGATQLGLCAMNRALQHIIDPRNLIVKEPGIIDKLYHLFFPKRPTKKSEHLGPCKAIIAGALYGKSSDTDNARIATSDKKADDKPWIANGLLENCGIVIKKPDGSLEYYLPSSASLSEQALYYGFCKGTEEEVSARGYVKVPDQHACLATRRIAS